MDLRLLTPLGALLAVTALVPLGVFLQRARRVRAISRALGLASPSVRSRLPPAAALAAVPALLGLAAAQPVLETTRTVPERTDAQAFVVLDASRSMLAAAAPDSPTRFERGRALAGRIRAEHPEVPFGIATLTDRVLPHLFPTTDERVFESTLSRAVGVERPPPAAFYLTHATNLNALRDVPAKSYFVPSAARRALVVLTDGETQAPTAGLASAFAQEPRTHVVLVHVWNAEEAIYEAGVAEGGYEPDSRSGAALARVASLVEGRVFEEDDVAGVVDALETALGTGETVGRKERSGRIALMPWITLAVLVPLWVMLLRRNFWWDGRRPRSTPVGERAEERRRARRFRSSLDGAREELARP